MSSRALFVYGTLRRGCANRHARLLDRSALFLGPARVQGRLYRVKWYPGMTLRGDAGDWVLGDLFQVRDPLTLTALDQYEGTEEYRRVLTMAVLENGDLAQCWVYEYIGPVPEERRMVSGDWLAEAQPSTAADLEGAEDD
jgi:gamma-glutamylcyclotransferase (GGCT)/AIG2-like uncharacterized protein YtfP